MKINEIITEAKATSQRLDPKCWKGKKIGNPKTKVKGGVRVNNCVPVEETYEGDEFYEAYGDIEETLEEAKYHGRTVPLNSPMRGDVKKFKNPKCVKNVVNLECLGGSRTPLLNCLASSLATSP